MESQDQNIRRVFEEGFCARDIAQTLRSFDAATPVAHAAAVLQQSGCEVAGVRTEGLVSGYLLADALTGSYCGDCQQPFAPEQLVSPALPLAELVPRLHVHPFCFVKAWEQPGAFVGKRDLQKPPGRMWLFGMVTFIEARFGRLIENHCTDDQWQECLSPGRIEKAAALRNERQKLGQQIALTDCLQFADKAQIIARTEKLRQLTRFASKNQIEKIGRKLERLRNNLAHSQDIVTGDWETIVALAENVASILDGPEVIQKPLAIDGGH